MQPIILYDTPGKVPNNIWAPNPAKTRQVDSLPYEVVWVEFKDIPMTMECQVGASTTEGGRYTLPVIKDPNTGFVVADSLAIAEYLDKTYPEKPVIPRGANVLIGLFEPAYCNVAYGKVVKLIVTKTLGIMNDSNREYFIRTRLELLGETSWEAVSEENVQQQWEDFKQEKWWEVDYG
ncbi:hypothetical protein BDR04DRAFT_1144644 [Suillus decipiens]|nr:hypothetical protein BDR04DRAFT_1144644 [Suillus decipiens]